MRYLPSLTTRDVKKAEGVILEGSVHPWKGMIQRLSTSGVTRHYSDSTSPLLTSRSHNYTDLEHLIP